MRVSRFSDAQVRDAIAEVAAGTPLITVCRRMGVTPTTFYRWRTKHGGATAADAVEVRALRSENQKLKQLVAELALERLGLQECLDKRARGAPPRGRALRTPRLTPP
jgi:putative transposase